MTLVYLQQVKSNRTKLIDFISDDDYTDRKEYCYSKHERTGIL